MPTENAPSNHRAITFVVSLALLLESLDSTILNTAIPAISSNLHVSPLDLKIVLITYLMSLAIFIPISGWISDKFGFKQTFLTAVAIFMVGSIGCGFAHNLIMLTAMRIFQGVGGALALPVGRLILLRTFPQVKFIIAVNHVAMMGSLGILLGPALGGIIVDHTSWRWIFWINIPFCLLTLVIAALYLPSSPPQKVPPLDKLGFALFGLGLAGLTFGLSALSDSDLSAVFVIYILLVSLILLMGYIWHVRRGRFSPIINTTLFRSRTFKLATSGNLLARLGFGSIPFLLPLLLQIELGYSAQTTGFLLMFNAFGIICSKMLVLPMLRLAGYKKLLLWNTALSGLAIMSFAFLNEKTATWYFVAGLSCFFSLVASLQYSAMNALAYSEMPREHFSAATSIMSTLQQLALSFGVALGALLIRFFSHTTQDSALTLGAFHRTFLAMGVLTFLSMIIFTRLKDTDGRKMIHSP